MVCQSLARTWESSVTFKIDPNGFITCQLSNFINSEEEEILSREVCLCSWKVWAGGPHPDSHSPYEEESTVWINAVSDGSAQGHEAFQNQEENGHMLLTKSLPCNVLAKYLSSHGTNFAWCQNLAKWLRNANFHAHLQGILGRKFSPWQQQHPFQSPDGSLTGQPCPLPPPPALGFQKSLCF